MNCPGPATPFHSEATVPDLTVADASDTSDSGYADGLNIKSWDPQPDPDSHILPHLPHHPIPTFPAPPAMNPPALPEPGPQPTPMPPPPTPGGHGADGVDGNPAAWAGDWFFEQENGLCGPSSVMQVVNEYTGQSVHDPQVEAQRAEQMGLLSAADPGQGMTTNGIQQLLSASGVSCHVENTSSIPQLETELAQGHGVIAIVDAEDIWDPNHQHMPDPGKPDHALVVAGINEHDQTVTLSDPGNPNGNQETVSLSQFEHAWATSGDQAVVADATDPHLADPDPT